MDSVSIPATLAGTDLPMLFATRNPSGLRRASLLLFAALLAGPAAAQTAGRWDSRWANPGIDREVLALASRPDGSLVAGGRFGGVEDAPKNVASWRDGVWSVLGTADTNGVHGDVYAAVTAGTNTYLGGEFNRTDSGIIVNGVVRWDGQAFHSLGNGPLAGVQGQVYAMATEGNSLYVAGRFRQAGTVSATNIVRWDGTNWTALGTGLGDGDNDRVTALLAGPDGVLYAGGTFQTAGNQPARRMARWDGMQWTEVGGGIDGQVHALGWHDNQLVAGGAFSTAGTVRATNIARWNGTNWSAMEIGVHREVSAIAVQGERLLIGGSFLSSSGGTPMKAVAVWSGSHWMQMGTGLNGGDGSAVRALVVRDDGVFAGGEFTAAGTTRVSRIARWDGSAWQSLAPELQDGNTPLITALAARGGEVIAGGSFTLAGGKPMERVARWDGVQWQPMGAGFNQGVLALAQGPGGQLYAGGNFTRVGLGGGEKVARWTGSEWANMGADINSEGTVYSLAVSPDGDVYAGGAFARIGESWYASVARWDGTRWNRLGEGGSSSGVAGTVRAMAWADGWLYVGGTFNRAGGLTVNNLARWNGTVWENVGGGVSTPGFQASVNALAFHEGALFVGGDFARAGENAFARLARWHPDTGAWSQPGGIPGGPVRTFAMLDGKLQMGGEFSAIGATPVRRLAQWEQGAWTELGGGVDGGLQEVTTLAAASTNLWVAGTFKRVGGLRASDLARWSIPLNLPPSVAFDPPATRAEFTNGSTITLRLTPSDPEGEAVTVRLTADGVPLAEISAAPFEFVWTGVFPGAYEVEAVPVDAQGKPGAPARFTVVVHPPEGDTPPEVAITAPVAGPLAIGEPFTLAAEAGDTDGHVIRVEFYRDSVLMGVATAAPFRVPALALPPGEFTLRAVATDDVGGTATSAPVAVRFVAPGPAPAPRWTFNTGSGSSSSVTLGTNGVLYLTPGPGGDKLIALNTNGTVRWRFQDTNSPLSWTSISDTGDIIATRMNWGLVAITPEGTKRWEFQAGQRSLGAPAIGRDGTIYFGGENQHLYAISGAGVMLWDMATGDPLASASPVIAGDGAIFLCSDHGNLICVNTNGTERWRFPVAGSISGAPAIGDDGTVYFSNSLGSLFAVDPASARRWEYKSGSTVLGGSPVIGPDGTIYFGVSDGNLHAVSPSGERRWAFKTDAELAGTPAVAEDGTIYCTGYNYKIYAVYPTGNLKWSAPTGGRNTSPVAIGADGTVYATSSDNLLYAIPGTSPLASSQWPKFHRDARQTGRGALPPQVALLAPADDASFLQPAPVLFSASASSPNGAVARVEFRLGDEVIGTDTAAPFEFIWTNPPAGVLGVNARVVDIAGASAVSASARILVSAAGVRPQIVTGPRPVVVAPGTNVTLSVEVLSQPPLTYQWLKDGTPLPSETSSTLVLTNVSAATSAGYSVRVENTAGLVTSEPALVTVLYPPEVRWIRDGASSGRPPALGPSGVIYSTTHTGALECRNRAGALIWSLPVGSATELVVADDGSLYFGRASDLVHVNAGGRELWSRPTGGFVAGLARTAGDTIYLTTEAGTLEAWSLSGTNRWTFPSLLTRATSPSITVQGDIIFSAGDGRIYCVRPDGTKRWEYDTFSSRLTKASIGPDGVIAAGVGSRVLALNPDGTRRWEYASVGDVAQPLIGPDGAIYAGAIDPRITTEPRKGRAMVLNADGSVRWELALPAPVSAAGSLAADGTWFLCSGPELFALNPNGTVRSRHAGGSSISGTTIGFDGTVYLASSFEGLQAVRGTVAMPTDGWPCATRDVRQRSDASSLADPDVWYFPFGSSAFDGPVTSIVNAPDGVYVGGEFTLAGGVPANRVAFWNGTNWFALGDGLTGPVREMVFFDGKLYVWSLNASEPGTVPPLLQSWDGAEWSRADGGLTEWPQALTVHEGALHAISQVRDGDDILRRYLMRYEGTNWIAKGPPVNGFIRQMISRTNGLHAANENFVRRFDGANWVDVGAAFGDTVYALHETPLGFFAGGGFQTGTNGGLVARWNGTNWLAAGGGLGAPEGFASSVFALARQGDSLLAAGYFTLAGTNNVPGLARWDGTNWGPLPGLRYFAEDRTGIPVALAVRGEEIFVGGSFLRLNGDSEMRYFGAFREDAWSAPGSKVVMLDGRLQVTLLNVLGRPYAVEVSGDLVNWTRVFLYENLDTPTLITIPDQPGSTGRFVRIVVP